MKTAKPFWVATDTGGATPTPLDALRGRNLTFGSVSGQCQNSVVRSSFILVMKRARSSELEARFHHYFVGPLLSQNRVIRAIAPPRKVLHDLHVFFVIRATVDSR